MLLVKLLNSLIKIKGWVNKSLITTSDMLTRELKKYEDMFVLAKIAGTDKEYIIDSVGFGVTHFDTKQPHLYLNLRDGGNGNIKR